RQEVLVEAPADGDAIEGRGVPAPAERVVVDVVAAGVAGVAGGAVGVDEVVVLEAGPDLPRLVGERGVLGPVARVRHVGALAAARVSAGRRRAGSPLSRGLLRAAGGARRARDEQ